MHRQKTKNVLLVAFHFPPIGFSSGLQRTLSLTRLLPDLRWRPVVLSANPRAYEATNEGQLSDIPEGTIVKRAFSLDTRKHLSVGGRYFRFMALPDPWAAWIIGGLVSGIGLIYKYRPAVIWTTYPIASAHLIGLILHKLSGLPWVADFRDSMTEPHYPADPSQRKVYKWIERQTVQGCDKVLFTTPGTLDMYRNRYPEMPERHWALIPNGYDESIFADIERKISTEGRKRDTTKLILLHSGLVYPSERDPSQFFEALSRLKRENKMARSGLLVRFRACGHENILRSMLRKNDIEDLVELLPSLPYREALTEIMTADALLILQASNCNHQVPAKLYEYFRAGRPVLGLTDPSGDTARVMRDAGLIEIVPLDDADTIADFLPDFFRRLEDGALSGATNEAVQKSSRKHSAVMLSRIFEDLVSTNDLT